MKTESGIEKERGTWMPLGESWAVRTRCWNSVSGIVLGWKILTAAILGADLRSENLKALGSTGLCRKRSELGYLLRILSRMDGPVSSNFRAPPTKQTAILERPNSSSSSFFLFNDWVRFWFGVPVAVGEEVGEAIGVELKLLGGTRNWKARPPRKKDRMGAKGMLVGEKKEEKEESERKSMKERVGMSKRSRRQSRSENHLAK